MATYTFAQLLERLPNCDEFNLRHNPDAGISYIDCETPRFVPPNLSDMEDESEDGPTQVLIVSAPGAVGKSTLAKAIAFDKKALLWDLAAAPEVAGGSLNGMLFSTLGTGQTDFLEFMTEGLQFLIIDALDEGRLKVNENSFQRLLEDIGQIAQLSKGLCFVLLGRTRVAETAWLVLEDLGVQVSMSRIEPFDREQANRYIENNISADKRSELLYECRDLIFEQLAFSVTETPDSDSARDFLHYPPVLDVVATLLKDESNPFELKNSLNELQDGSIQLLQSVITRILDREQTKVLPAVRGSLNEAAESLNWSDWDSLYSSKEQCQRLLGIVLHQQVSVVPENLPNSVKALYENSEEVTTGLAVHPFLQGVDRFANRVFESYLYACALLDDFGSDLKQFVTEKLLKQERLPTRLLADFYLAVNDMRPDIPRTILPEHLGIIYDSLLSSESNRSHVRLNINGADPLDDPPSGIELVEVEFEFFTFSSPSESQPSFPDSIAFVLPIQGDSKISFGSYLRDARITVPCTVELGTSGREVTIGPSVHISADAITFRSGSLIVGGHTRTRTVEEEDDSVVLEARVCDWASLNNNPPIVYEADKFYVSWPGDQQYLWMPYRAIRSEDDFNDNESLSRVYKRFRRIAVEFQSHGKGRLAKTRVKIESQRIMRGALERRLLDQLKADKILDLTGGWYFWIPEYAGSRLGVSWQDLKRGEIPPLLKDYLSRFIQQNPDLF